MVVVGDVVGASAKPKGLFLVANYVRLRTSNSAPAGTGKRDA